MANDLMDDGNDKAIVTALELLEGTVCECGHVDSEHSCGDDKTFCDSPDDPECDCTEFRPVNFHVVRADEQEPTR